MKNIEKDVSEPSQKGENNCPKRFPDVSQRCQKKQGLPYDYLASLSTGKLFWALETLVATFTQSVIYDNRLQLVKRVTAEPQDLYQ